jgi:type I restriction enzyme S subunit
MPYELPANWGWARLPSIASYKPGKTPSTKNPSYWSDNSADVPWVSISDMEHFGVLTETSKKITSEAAERVFGYEPIPKGSLLMSFKLTVGKMAILGVDAYHNEAILSIQPYSGIARDYLFKVLPARAQAGNTKRAIMGDTLNATSLSLLLIPVPPFAEQHRIVAKVDELMALCDELEQQQNDSLVAHQTLVETLLGTLTRVESQQEFSAAWARIASHFDTLFITEHSIDQLKQTILQLAVMGKLVSQDPNDEPASVFLEKVAQEKVKLIKAGKIRKQKELPEVKDDDIGFNLSAGWAVSRLGTFTNVGTGATPSRDKAAYWSPQEVNWVASGETSNDFITETSEKISSLAVKETNVTVYPIGTLILAMYGQGKTRGQVSELMIEAGTNQACAAVVLINEDEAHRKYLKLFFKKAYEEMRSHSAGGAQPNLNVGKISNTVVPIPPLAEQHRIVAKVDELMALCDTLNARLKDAQTTQIHLADAIVEQAVC